MITEVSIAVVICATSYFLGCFSMARMIAKGFRNLNIYKIGTRMADAENIYLNISAPLGLLCGILDFVRVAGYLLLLRYIFTFESLKCYEILVKPTMLFAFGVCMIAGHCLPVLSKFKGGRGIFSYMGLLAVFAPWEMLAIFVVACIFTQVFKQIRFAQYFIVLTPPIVYYFINGNDDFILSVLMFNTAFLMGILNFVVSKKYGEL